jgi:hypothetical protein
MFNSTSYKTGFRIAADCSKLICCCLNVQFREHGPDLCAPCGTSDWRKTFRNDLRDVHHPLIFYLRFLQSYQCRVDYIHLVIPWC